MREITYAGGSFVTSDEIAQALLEYGAALANADRAATVHVPAIAGGAPDVTVLVGPASQLMATPYDGSGEDPDGAKFITDVGDRIKILERTFTYPGPGSSIEWDI
jgi:hypothetical protein